MLVGGLTDIRTIPFPLSINGLKYQHGTEISINPIYSEQGYHTLIEAIKKHVRRYVDRGHPWIWQLMAASAALFILDNFVDPPPNSETLSGIGIMLALLGILCYIVGEIGAIVTAQRLRLHTWIPWLLLVAVIFSAISIFDPLVFLYAFGDSYYIFYLYTLLPTIILTTIFATTTKSQNLDG